MTLPSDRDIEISVEVSKELYETRSKDCDNFPPYALSAESKALNILIQLAQAYLSTKGLPEEAIYTTYGLPEIKTPFSKEYVIGFNECLRLCKLAMMKGQNNVINENKSTTQGKE